MNITDFIGRGRENATSREELCRRVNLSDRKVRKLIEQARKRGEIIINDGTGVGYYISEELADLTAQYRMNQHRAMSILVQQKYLRKKIREAELENVKAEVLLAEVKK